MADMLIEDIGTVVNNCEEEGGEAAGYSSDLVMEDEKDEEAEMVADEVPSTSIIVTNLLAPTFDDPHERDIFESLFHDIDETVTFQYFKSFRRVRVNFASHAQATQARDKLHMTEFSGEIIKCYFTQGRPMNCIQQWKINLELLSMFVRTVNPLMRSRGEQKDVLFHRLVDLLNVPQTNSDSCEL
ncbi:hypothetical protein OTU49_015672 [Cherax quadricarinatus]|uniref:Uncharacterized protein n=1 Tax=Cherax quadricarinatus TaxID=27406 RepID=A0AAW0YBR3_CHEQU